MRTCEEVLVDGRGEVPRGRAQRALLRPERHRDAGLHEHIGGCATNQSTDEVMTALNGNGHSLCTGSDGNGIALHVTLQTQTGRRETAGSAGGHHRPTSSRTGSPAAQRRSPSDPARGILRMHTTRQQQPISTDTLSPTADTDRHAIGLYLPRSTKSPPPACSALVLHLSRASRRRCEPRAMA